MSDLDVVLNSSTFWKAFFGFLAGGVGGGLIAQQLVSEQGRSSG